MKTATKRLRCYEEITQGDLRTLRQKVKEIEDEFFEKHKKYSDYKNKLIGIVLCQGAAKHYLDKTTGIKDFDVWLFYRKNHQQDMNRRRVKSRDCGLPKFGKILKESLKTGVWILLQG